MQKVINKAREILVNQGEECGLPSFESDIRGMRFEKNIIFDTFQNYAKLTGVPPLLFNRIKDGCTLINADTHIILTHALPKAMLHRFVSSDTATRLRNLQFRNNWTLAHEVGHVILGHIKDDAEEERQANLFASELLMPELVILELKRRLERSLPTHELSGLFGVSVSAANTRISQIERRECFSAYLKHEIMKKYESLIDEYVIKNKEKLCLTITV